MSGLPYFQDAEQLVWVIFLPMTLIKVIHFGMGQTQNKTHMP